MWKQSGCVTDMQRWGLAPEEEVGLSLAMNFNHITKTNLPFSSNLDVKVICDKFIKLALFS